MSTALSMWRLVSARAVLRFLDGLASAQPEAVAPAAGRRRSEKGWRPRQRPGLDGLLSDQHLGRLDDHHHLVALLEVERVARRIRDGGHHLARLDLYLHLRHHRAGLDGGDPSPQLVACAELHETSSSWDSGPLAGTV